MDETEKHEGVDLYSLFFVCSFLFLSVFSELDVSFVLKWMAQNNTKTDDLLRAPARPTVRGVALRRCTEEVVLGHDIDGSTELTWALHGRAGIKSMGMVPRMEGRRNIPLLLVVPGQAGGGSFL